MSYIDFQKLKEQVSLHQVMQLLKLDMKQSGGVFRGSCPMHPGDRTLAITPGKGFYCFPSKKGGDQIALVAHVRDCSVREAAEYLTKYFGDPSTVPNNSPSPLKGLEAVAGYIQPTHEAVQALGISEETAKALGIGFAPRGTMVNRVVFPVRNGEGRIVGYIGYAPEADPVLKFPRQFYL